MESNILWSWRIWGYLWLAGVAGGAYFSAFLTDRYDDARRWRLTRIATLTGIPLVLVGSLFLVIDLGHPFRAWHLFASINVLSPMWLGSWILLLWSVIAFALIAVWFAQGYRSAEPSRGLLACITKPLQPAGRGTNLLAWANFALSILLIAYTGVLLSTTSVSLWATVFLPALFVVSAVSTGRGAVLGVLALSSQEIPRQLEKSGPVLIVLEALAIVAFLATVPAGSLIAGPLAVYFWLGVVLLGLLIPAVMDFWAVRKHANRRLILASTVCVLLGALTLRWVVVMGGQM